MALYLCKRIVSLIPTLLLLIFITIALLRLTPGDAVDQILGDYASLEEKTLLREKLGLNQSLASQSVLYFSNLFSGDLGFSLIYHKPVLELILERLPATLELAFLAIFLSFSLGLGAGFLLALWRGTKKEFFLTVFSLLGVAIPNFWLGPLLILVFSLWFNILPVSGYSTPAHYVLPVLTMGLSLMAIVTKMTGESLKANIGADYTRVARGKGLSFSRTLFIHVLKNSAIPIITIISLQFSVLLTGALVTESIFDWPGLGTLILEALRNRDYPLVQGCVLFFAFSYSLLSLLTDMIYVFLDPRISLAEKRGEE